MFIDTAVKIPKTEDPPADEGIPAGRGPRCGRAKAPNHQRTNGLPVSMNGTVLKGPRATLRRARKRLTKSWPAHARIRIGIQHEMTV